MSTFKTRPVTACALTAISALLSTLTMPPFNQGSIVWFSLVPALSVLWHTVRASESALFKQLKTSVGLGFLYGLIFFGTTFYWIGHVTVLGTMLLVIYLALYPALWFCWMTWTAPASEECSSGDHIRCAVTGACAWVAIDWWRGWFLTGFGWNTPAISQHLNPPMMQLAAIGGIHLITWVIVFANISLALIIRRSCAEYKAGHRVRRHYDFYVLIIVMMGAFLYGFKQLRKPLPPDNLSLRYACVQPNIPQTAERSMSNTEVLDRHLMLTECAKNLAPDIVLWPETTTGQAYATDPEMIAGIESVRANASFALMFGAVDRRDKDLFNSIFWLAPGQSQPEIYHKNHLVPFGEYIPLVNHLPFLRGLVPFTIDFSAGSTPGLFMLEKPPLRIAPLLCFEDTISRGVRKAVSLNPDILIDITNDGWFLDSPASAQHLANAVFRCVEFDRPMIRCANTGITCEINQRGIPVKILTEEGKTINFAGTFPPAKDSVARWHAPRVTFYQRFGDWIVLLSALVTGIVAWNFPGKGRKTLVSFAAK